MHSTTPRNPILKWQRPKTRYVLILVLVPSYIPSHVNSLTNIGLLTILCMSRKRIMAVPFANTISTNSKLVHVALLLLVGNTSLAASYKPAWASIEPKQTIAHRPLTGANPEQNGVALVKAVSALQPGDRLEIGAGKYSVKRMWDLLISGTAEAPIWIVAAPDALVVITRPDDKQNVLNVGQGGPVNFLCLRGLEFTGGSHGVQLGQCRDVWVDRCHIHHTSEVCLSANSADTQRLYLTGNHIHHGGGHAEGMYLGGNNARLIMSQSVIAQNHIHDCRGNQGDGIEVKQGSWGNLIAENHVHDTNYPCITVYGTNGQPNNIVECNLCYRSGDSVMQVQGEAIVRNNVLIAGKNGGFRSTDHQGKTLNLQVIHNTIVSAGHAFAGGSWNDREGMILANNVLYSRDANALNFPNGNAGVHILGNVVLGDGPKAGCTLGRGLEDFRNLSWNGGAHDATPTAHAPLDCAAPQFLLDIDFYHKPRQSLNTSGAVAR